MTKFESFFKPSSIEIKGVRLPEIVLPSEEYEKYEVKPGSSNFDFIYSIALNTLDKKIKSGIIPQDREREYKERLDYEINIINEVGFIDYILLVWDVLNFCRKNGISVGPGRGCLSGNSMVRSKNGLKPIKDIKQGDVVLNGFGKWAEVIKTHKYDCKEDLIQFNHFGSSFRKPSFTKDHHILIVKNPFNSYPPPLSGEKKYKEKIEKHNLVWEKACNIQPGDYLVRYKESFSNNENCEYVDLLKFKDEKDEFSDLFILENKNDYRKNSLSTRELSRGSGITRDTIVRFIRGEKTTEKSKIKINEYLLKLGKTREDILNKITSREDRISRFIKTDDVFYILGFYVGDGCMRKNQIIFAINSDDNKTIEKFDSFCKNYGFHFNKIKQNNKKLLKYYINSKTLGNFIKFYCSGKCISFDKKLDYQLLSKNQAKGVISGLIDSDGSITDGRISFDNTIPDLINSFRYLYEKTNGAVVSVMRREKNTEKKRPRDSYKCRVVKSKNSRTFTCNEYNLLRVDDVKIVKNEENYVYDLSIKGDPSYSVEDFSVHNSACGSLLSNLIGITEIDSVKYELYFERFLSKARAKSKMIDGVRYIDGSMAPDIDIDICHERRQEVVSYLEEKYNGKFCKLPTFQTLSSKILIKECCKIVKEYSEDQAKEISDLIPSVFGKVYEIDKARENVDKFNEFCKNNDDIYQIALKLHGLIRNKSSHASAYLISYDPFINKIPCELGSNGEIICSYDMSYAQKENIKLDLLGLDAVTLVGRICKTISETTETINVEDKSIYAALDKLEQPYGLFQISGEAVIRVIDKIKPKELKDISAISAIARPGAFAFVDDYANGVEAPFENEQLKEILKETNGIVLYQEETMAIASKVFGLSLEDGEMIRRCTAKKDSKKMAVWEPVLKEQAKKLKLESGLFEWYWNILQASADYSFNKCLSPNTVVETPNGYKRISDIRIGDSINSFDTKTNKIIESKVLNIYKSNVTLYEFKMSNGSKIKCSQEHKFLCSDGQMRPIKTILTHNHKIVCRDNSVASVISHRGLRARKSIDLEVDHPDHNFIAEGLVTSNSHAIAYSSLSAITVYLKFNYPLEFFYECLKIAQNKAKPQEEIAKIQRELPYFGIRLLPPDLTKSGLEFSIEGKDIRFGLSSIKGISDNSFDKLIQFINKKTLNKFEIFRAAKECKLGIGILSALIQAGAIDSLDIDRPKSVLEAQLWNLLSEKEQIWCLQNGNKYNYSLITMIKDIKNWKSSDGKPVSRATRFDTIKKRYEPYKNIFMLNKKYPTFAAWSYEKALLGYSYSTGLKDVFSFETKGLKTISEIRNIDVDRKNVDFVAEIETLIEGKSKAGNKYMKFTCVDETGEFGALFVGDKLEKFLEESKKPKEGNIVYIKGSKSKDIVFIDKLVIQDYKIYLKLKDLK